MKKLILLSSMSSFVVRGVFLNFLFTCVFLLPLLNDAGAVTPSTNEIQKLLASGGAAGDLFGRSVAISGDRAIVGAYRDDDNGSDSGSAYVFERDAMGNWNEVDKLTASDAATGDRFGISVSISGDRAIVGAYLDEDNGSQSGSAYVFEFDNPKELLLNSDAGDASTDVDINSVEVTQTDSTLNCKIELASGTEGLSNKSMFQCHIDFDDFEDEGVSGCDANGNGSKNTQVKRKFKNTPRTTKLDMELKRISFFMLYSICIFIYKNTIGIIQLM